MRVPSIDVQNVKAGGVTRYVQDLSHNHLVAEGDVGHGGAALGETLEHFLWRGSGWGWRSERELKSRREGNRCRSEQTVLAVFPMTTTK